MQLAAKVKSSSVSIILLMVLGMFAVPGVPAETCTEGLGVPPFLGVESIPPNLLIMMDNSGSMYDLNYVEDAGYCFDDNYSNSQIYAGYFLDIDEYEAVLPVWYYYDRVGGDFVRTTEADVIAGCNAATGTQYRAADPTSGAYYLCAKINEPSPDPMTHSMSYFAATGRFLNWLVSSKMDIQKQVLSGGKWNGTQLIAESRGCLGNRFVKEVVVNNGTANLTFSIAGDEDDIDGDSNRNNTTIGMFAASSEGFNNEACLETIQALQSPKGVGGVSQPLQECMGDPPQKSQEGDLVTAMNLSIQDCWYMAKFGIDEWRKVFSPSAIRNQCEKLYEGGLGGFYPESMPWELPDGITGLVCKGDYDTTDGIGTDVAGFVGRCYVPDGHFKIAGIDDVETGIAASGRDAKASSLGSSSAAWGMTLASVETTEGERSAGNDGQVQPDTSAGLSPERASLIESLKEFISSGGRSRVARSNVMQSVYDFFVSEVEAAPGQVEESAATCIGDWRAAAGFSIGSLYSKDVGDICTFPTAGWVYIHGYYTIEVASPCDSAQGNSSVEWTVNHVNGVTAYTQDQLTDCGKWVTIPGPETGGTFELLDDGSGSVVVTSNSTSKRTYADVVRYTLVEEILPEEPDLGPHPYVVSIIRNTPSPTDQDSVSFNVTFSEEVINFNNEDDLIITETGTLSHTGVLITGGPKAYLVTITGLSGEGEISIDVNTWIRNWQENSALQEAKFNEQQHFYVAGPYPGNVQLGSYVVKIVEPVPGECESPLGNVCAEETNLSVGFTTGLQPRSGPFIDYPNDINCCTGAVDAFGNPIPEQNFCCTWPLAINFTHYLTSDGWSDAAFWGGAWDEWQVGDTITFDIVTGSDVRSIFGSIVTFGKRSAAIERVEPAPVFDCDFPGNINGPAWLCDKCVENAIVDFCGFLDTPQVPDPSDQSGLAGEGEYWNVPALIWDEALNLQLENAIAIMSAKRRKPEKPLGIIHEYGDKIRFGLMKYRGTGDKSECGDYDLFTNCATDGAYVDIPIGENTLAHADIVASALNSEPATTWTPLAESMYTAIGYYTQKGSMRLNSVNDFAVNADAAAASSGMWSAGGTYAAGQIVEHNGVYFQTPGGGTSTAGIDNIYEDEDIVDWVVVNDPIIASCQRNFMLFITEGSSTADLSQTVADFAAVNGDGDAETATTGCDVLKGSTYLDDLVYYAYEGSDIYEYEEFAEQKNNIEVHIVNTQSPRSAGLTGECSPYENLASAAANTALVAKDLDGYIDDDPLYYGGNPQELYRAIRQVFNNIITQTSSGSAASVISASREGEGALYQALFWPASEAGLAPPNPQYINWTGEVHAFLVDSFGNLREDSNNNGALDAADEYVVVYYDAVLEKTRACNGTVTDGICTGTSKELQLLNYLWSSTEYLNRDAVDTNILENRQLNIDGSFDFSGLTNKDKRYIFTWNDLNNDGAVDQVTEILPFTENFGGGGGFPNEGDGFGNPLGRSPVEYDFQIPAAVPDGTAWANSIIRWVRGQDQVDMRSRQILGDNNGEAMV
jgi:hypothetical protein